MGKRPQKLLDQVRETIRRKHCSIHTEAAYASQIKRYILFHNKRPPKDKTDHSHQTMPGQGGGKPRTIRGRKTSFRAAAVVGTTVVTS